jgi:hypothetical protein
MMFRECFLNLSHWPISLTLFLCEFFIMCSISYCHSAAMQERSSSREMRADAQSTRLTTPTQDTWCQI